MCDDIRSDSLEMLDRGSLEESGHAYPTDPFMTWTFDNDSVISPPDKRYERGCISSLEYQS